MFIYNYCHGVLGDATSVLVLPFQIKTLPGFSGRIFCCLINSYISSLMPFTIEELLGSKYFIIALGVALIYCMYRLANRKKRYFLQNGYPATATVLSIYQTGFSRGNYDKIYEIKLQVENEDKTTRVVTTTNAYDTRFDEKPQPGNQINILIDPKNPERVMVTPQWYNPHRDS